MLAPAGSEVVTMCDYSCPGALQWKPFAMATSKS
jgi:hypothetical protein